MLKGHPMMKWVVGALAVSVFLSFLWHENKAVKAGKQEVIDEYANAAAEQAVEALQSELELVKAKGKADEQLIREKQALVAERDALIRSLQQRLKRPQATEANPTPPSSGEACTGAQLYKEDGEFLAREAARAEELIVQRDYYYERYEDARQQLEKLNGKD